MREHLISKNVAADVAEKICESVSTKLAGKTLGSFESLTTNIRQAMRETLMTILTPKRRIDILRDVVDAQRAQRPYVITFCGVNGVGKSTNLAKVIEMWTARLSPIRSTFLGGLLAQWQRSPGAHRWLRYLPIGCYRTVADPCASSEQHLQWEEHADDRTVSTWLRKGCRWDRHGSHQLW